MKQEQYLKILEKSRLLHKQGKTELALNEIEQLWELRPLDTKVVSQKANIEKTLISTNNMIERYSSFSSYYVNKETNRILLDIVAGLFEGPDSIFLSKTYKYICALLNQESIEAKEIISNINNELNYDIQQYFDDILNKETYVKLAQSCRASADFLGELIFRTYLVIAVKMNIQDNYALSHIVPYRANYGYLYEKLVNKEEPSVFCICVSKEGDEQLAMAMALAIKSIGHEVYMFSSPFGVEVENKMSLAETMSISLDPENIEYKNDIPIIRPIELSFEGKSLGTNLSYLLEGIGDSANKGMAMVIAPGNLMNSLSGEDNLRKKFERLSTFESPVLEDKFAFGYVGKYTSYISDIYNMDVESEIEAEETCEFSIVVPARNYADTLRYTLETCLNQDYEDYEIVVSDNSAPGVNNIYELCMELNNPKIKYFRAPRELPLQRNFEYAFLKSRGRFVFSIGSDDGVLTWALQTLHEVLRRPEMKTQEFLQWDRGFYVWPEFSNKSQENQFSIPKAYQKNNVKLNRYQNKEYLEFILTNPQNMYILPMLYINSGFKRKYLKRVLRQTGRLWNGQSQDIYTGIMNLAINEYTYILEYPLTIAGMSSNSIGATHNLGFKDDRECKKASKFMCGNNVGSFCATDLEFMFPILATDYSNLYTSVMRLIKYGVLNEEILAALDIKTIFKSIIGQQQITDIYLHKNLQWAQYSASLYGKEMEEWFEEGILKPIMNPKEYVSIEAIEEQRKTVEKAYSEGFSQSGGLTLDASKFGVTNIAEAVELFAKITNL